MASRGGQPGNQNAAKKPFSEAIRRALLQQDGKKLRALAEKIIEAALEGDVSAMKEIGDRVDGKAIQQIEAAVEGSLVVQIVRYGDDSPTP